jgi:hypothetical protein
MAERRMARDGVAAYRRAQKAIQKIVEIISL